MTQKYCCCAARSLAVVLSLVFAVGREEFIDFGNREAAMEDNRAVIISNLAEQTGIDLPSHLTLVHTGGNGRLDDAYREWILFSERPSNLGAIVEAGADPRTWIKDFTVDGVTAVLETSLTKKLESPKSAETGIHENETYSYSLLVLYVEEGAYLMVRRIPKE